MRFIAKAACGLMAAAVLAAAGPAYAEDWSDPNGVITVTEPRGWDTMVERTNNQDITYFVSSSASQECHVYLLRRAEWAAFAVDVVRRSWAQPWPTTNWETIGRELNNEYIYNRANGPLQLQSSRVDTAGMWPVQRAVFSSQGQEIHVAVMGRPGYELQAYCKGYNTAPDTAAYDGFVSSIRFANDAQWQADYEASQAAAPPAPPEAD